MLASLSGLFVGPFTRVNIVEVANYHSPAKVKTHKYLKFHPVDLSLHVYNTGNVVDTI